MTATTASTRKISLLLCKRVAQSTTQLRGGMIHKIRSYSKTKPTQCIRTSLSSSILTANDTCLQGRVLLLQLHVVKHTANILRPPRRTAIRMCVVMVKGWAAHAHIAWWRSLNRGGHGIRTGDPRWASRSAWTSQMVGRVTFPCIHFRHSSHPSAS